MAGQLQSKDIIDFSGGVNLAANPFLIPKKQLLRIRNMILDEHGSLRTRPGISEEAISQETGSSPVLYIGSLNANDGTNKRFCVQRVGSANRLYEMTPYPWQPRGVFSTSYITPQSATMTGAEIFAAGYETPKAWTGTGDIVPITATGGQTVPPGAKHLAFHLGGLWVWNTNPTTTALDGPSALRMSTVNNYNDWPNANQTFISKDDGQVGMGLSIYTIAEAGISPTQTLVAFKTYSAYQVAGSLAGTFSVTRIKSDLGCIAPRTIQYLTGFGIIRLTHKGFALFNGVDDKLVSEDIRPAIFGNSDDPTSMQDFVSVDFTNIQSAWGAQIQNPPMYIAACPVTGAAGLTRFFILDLIRKTWTISDFPAFMSCIMSVLEPGGVTVLAGETSGGRIFRLMDYNDTDDLGAPIEWSFTTPPQFFGSPTRFSYWRRLLVDLVSAPIQQVDFSTTIQGFVNPLETQRTMDMMVREGRTDVDINRKSSAIQARISGIGQVRVRGISFHGRPMQLTRALGFQPSQSGHAFDTETGNGFDATVFA